MPPLKQPKDLTHICYLSFASLTSKSIYFHRNCDEKIAEMRELFADFPSRISEELYFWVIQNAAGFLSAFALDDEDDKEILQRQCRYLKAASRIFLNSKMKKIEQSFTVNLSLFPNFGGFKVKPEEEEEFAISEKSILAEDEFLTELDEVQKLREPFINFFSSEPNDLETFEMGLFLQGRPDEAAPGFEPGDAPRRYSLIWTNPAAFISLVDNCWGRLTRLNLDGYEELNDLAVDYLAGKTGGEPRNEGLKQLVYVKLPKKSFITERSFKALLENLPRLEVIDHPGKMGVLCENESDLLSDGRTFNLKVFSQMESIDSGAKDEDDEDEDDFEIKPWNPSLELLRSIRRSFPRLTQLKLLVDDASLGKFAQADFGRDLEAIEIHATWSGFAALDILAASAAETLTEVTLEILEGYSWNVVASVGKHCRGLTAFKATIWSEYIEDVDVLEEILEDKEERFESLRELTVKCESHVEYFPNIIFFYFLTCGGDLRIIDYAAPLSWITSDVVKTVFSHPRLSRLEMFILNNTSGDEMRLGNEDIESLLDNCTNLTALGNVRTWAEVDYYDPRSEFYFKSESKFTKLKRRAKDNNWDIDFDLENLNFLNNL